MHTDENEAADPKPQDAASPALSADEIKGLATEFAAKLGEKSGKPIQQIGQLIDKCGLDFVEKIMAETEATEVGGGMLTQDKKRRRTKGGVFFFLAKGQMDPEYRTEIFPNLAKHGDGTIMPPGIEWEQRITPMQSLREGAGQINNLTVTLTGRPGDLHIEGSSVMAVIRQQEVKAPPYPKGVPPFSSVTGVTDFYVFIGLRHWQKVEKALENEDDMLIVEGSVVYDPQLDGITILSTGVTTKILEQQKRQSKTQPRKSQSGQVTNASAGGRQARAGTALTRPDLSGLPEEAADKLRQLYDAADKLRQKIATMEDKEQKSGVTMTRRLLDQTEKQINILAKQYSL